MQYYKLFTYAHTNFKLKKMKNRSNTTLSPPLLSKNFHFIDNYSSRHLINKYGIGKQKLFTNFFFQRLSFVDAPRVVKLFNYRYDITLL